MASNKFFTNTYITGTGRQNYLRADYLEDPLFTSFTFDIDFISSPLFYTINNYTYPHPDNIGISEQIQNALAEMRKKMMPDQGYDILPLYSAEFLQGDKLGFGLQQNVYMDLPLYGATEYIYMVDKRNGDGSQNDVRYDDNSGSANNGGFKSYKLGDSVKEAVSKSDSEWANKKNEDAYAQIAHNDAIMNDEKIKDAHNANTKDMETKKNNYDTYTVSINGVDGKFTEEQIQKKVNDLKALEIAFDQLKTDIANWINESLSTIQSEILSIFNQNACVKKLVSYEDSTKHEDELKKLFGEDWVKTYIWDAGNKDANAFINKSLKKYNSFETYETVPSGSNGIQYLSSKDSDSLLIKTKSGDEKATVRSSRIKAKFEDRLKSLEVMKPIKNKEDKITGYEDFKGDIKVAKLKEAPDWGNTDNLPERVRYWTKDGISKDTVKTLVIDPLCYKCDIDTCFVSFESELYTKNHTELGKYEAALEQIRSELYGTSDSGGVNDASNPSPDSIYGQYLAAKDKCENDDYSQAVKAISIAQSGIIETNYATSNDEQNTTEETSNGVSTNIQQTEKEPEPIITPQTVLDMLGFISGMRRMTTEYPYIIQSITGLDKAYETHYGVKDPYMGSGDNKISLTCWESLDLRVTTMFNRYFNAVYDRQYRRERVPINLRRFNCSVYVHDVRNFVTNNTNGKYANRMLELTDMYYSAIEFKFYDCEIVPEETGNIFNDISNEAPTEMKKTNFTFTYGNCVVNFVPQSEVAKYR